MEGGLQGPSHSHGVGLLRAQSVFTCGDMEEGLMAVEVRAQPHVGGPAAGAPHTQMGTATA